MEDLTRSKQLLEQLNFGVSKHLEKKKGINQIKIEDRDPADRHTVLAWEQKNGCFLPEDLKTFYLTTDGFQMTWSVKLDSGPLPVGKMYIHKINDLVRIAANVGTTNSVNPSLLDLESDSDTEDEISGHQKPSFGKKNKLFELDPCDGFGKVCLVYKTGSVQPNVEVWFLDRSLRWHFLADSFMSYYRLMLMHLGLPQWQYSFTDIGLSHQTKQWFNMYAPLRLTLNGELADEAEGDVGTTPLVQIDVSKVFKGKSDKKKSSSQNPSLAQQQQQQQLGLKKKSLSSARSQGTNNKVSTSSSQISSSRTTK